MDPRIDPCEIRLYWLPLGAGGVGFVRLNGRIYESIVARRQRRRPAALYHTALEVEIPAGRFVIENAWPSPDTDVASRGVVFEGPVFHPRLARMRAFRYEVRRWQDGSIPDAAEAALIERVVASESACRRLLDLVASVPHLTWGRDEIGSGEMWNSNSVIAFLLAASGLSPDAAPPQGGRAPGWQAGVLAASNAPLPPPEAR